MVITKHPDRVERTSPKKAHGLHCGAQTVSQYGLTSAPVFDWAGVKRGITREPHIRVMVKSKLRLFCCFAGSKLCCFAHLAHPGVAEPREALPGGAAPDDDALPVHRGQVVAVRRPLHKGLRPRRALVHLLGLSTSRFHMPVLFLLHCVLKGCSEIRTQSDFSARSE